MPSDSYTVSQAARRMGVGVAAIRRRIGDDLVAVSSDPMRIRAAEVEEARENALAKFDDVFDTTEGMPSAVIDPRKTHRVLATQIAATEMLDEGLETARRALRLLSEAAEEAVRPGP